MNRPIGNDTDFIRSLTPRLRAYFLQREKERHNRLQDALRGLTRGLGVGQLNGEAQGLALERMPVSGHALPHPRTATG
jgi:hypothetical protein